MGREYPVIEGVPVLLVAEESAAARELEASGARGTAPLYVESALLPDEALKQAVLDLAASRPHVDALVQYLVAATGGLAYRHLVGRLEHYPIPKLRLPVGQGRTLLDVGCSWGRWSVAAARLGYQVVGLDPSLAAVLAARRVMSELGLADKARFVVGDARCLPFRAGVFDEVFSYSVLQHLSKADATRAVAGVARSLRPGGSCLIQMPIRWGLRCLYNLWRRGWSEGEGFEVRYWSSEELRAAFGRTMNQVELSVDCYFGIGWQWSDARLMPWPLRCVLVASEVLRRLSQWLPPLRVVADSVYVKAEKPKESGNVN